VLARQDAGAVQMEMQAVDLSELVVSACREWRVTAEQMKIDLQFERPEAALAVLGSQDGLERLLRMLIDNACRYTRAGGVVRVGAERRSGQAGLWVQDTGIGIPEEERPHIFERFYRGRGAQMMQRSGSGLGLSLAKWIADQHKATITVQGTVGNGSCFRVSFPEHLVPDAQ